MPHKLLEIASRLPLALDAWLITVAVIQAWGHNVPLWVYGIVTAEIVLHVRLIRIVYLRSKPS